MSPFPRCTLAFPAPPSLRPLTPCGQITAQVVRGIADAILRGASFRTAAMAAHTSHDFGEWERKASLGEDPFWPWAVAVVRSAQAQALQEVEEAHHGVAIAGTLPSGDAASPSAVRAQENRLKALAGSDIYREAPTGHGGAGAGGSAAITIRNIQILLQGGAGGGAAGGAPLAGALGTALGAITDRAWGGRTAPGQEEPLVIDAPAPAAERPTAAPAKANFRRAPRD